VPRPLGPESTLLPSPMSDRYPNRTVWHNRVSRTARTGQHRCRGQCTGLRCALLYLPACENFLYVFKAARRAARAAATAPRPSLSLTLHSGRANAGRLARKRETRAADDLREFQRLGCGYPCSLCGIVQGRSEPVKAVCDRRTTAPVEVRGQRTREDDLDGTRPDQEMAAIGSRDTSGQILDA
jgi:hypothetical protein